MLQQTVQNTTKYFWVVLRKVLQHWCSAWKDFLQLEAKFTAVKAFAGVHCQSNFINTQKRPLPFHQRKVADICSVLIDPQSGDSSAIAAWCLRAADLDQEAGIDLDRSQSKQLKEAIGPKLFWPEPGPQLRGRRWPSQGRAVNMTCGGSQDNGKHKMLLMTDSNLKANCQQKSWSPLYCVTVKKHCKKDKWPSTSLRQGFS